MNKLPLYAAGLAILALTGCKGGENGQNDAVNSDSIQLYQTREELQATLAVQDSLFALINEIGADMAQIRQMEAVVAMPANINGENTSKREQMKNDISAISQALAQRRQRLAELEKKLRDSNSQNATMLSTIETLKAQIADQEHEITSLKEQLTTAQAQISTLNVAVDSLNTTVASERSGKEEAQREAQKLNSELNTCYYAIGSKSELQAHNIIRTGFLRKTKIMQGDFEMSYFTKADKRNFTAIQLHSNKAKVLTNQPADSYEITNGAGGQKVLLIKNPNRFWGTSNFLVVQID